MSDCPPVGATPGASESVIVDLDTPALNIADFPRSYRFKMVRAYPIISAVPNVYTASHEEIDAAFERILQCRNLRRTHEMFLEERRG